IHLTARRPSGIFRLPTSWPTVKPMAPGSVRRSVSLAMSGAINWSDRAGLTATYPCSRRFRFANSFVHSSVLRSTTSSIMRTWVTRTAAWTAAAEARSKAWPLTPPCVVCNLPYASNSKRRILPGACPPRAPRRFWPVQKFAQYHPRAWKARKGFPRTTPLRLFAMAFCAALCGPVIVAQDRPATLGQKSNLAEAQTLLKQGKTEQALKLLGGLATSEPEAAGLETAFGTAYFQSHKFPLAIEHLKKALTRNPDDLEATQVLALSFYGSGDFASAAPLLEKLGPRLPASSPDGPYLLGICYIMTQRWDDARRAFAQLFSVPPESAM